MLLRIEAKNIGCLLAIIIIFISCCCSQQNRTSMADEAQCQAKRMELFKVEAFNDSLYAFVNRNDSIPGVEYPVLYHVYLKKVRTDTIVIFYANFGFLCGFVDLTDDNYGTDEFIGIYEYEQKHIAVYNNGIDSMEVMVNRSVMTHDGEKYNLIASLGIREVIRISKRIPQNYNYPFVQYKVSNGVMTEMPKFRDSPDSYGL